MHLINFVTEISLELNQSLYRIMGFMQLYCVDCVGIGYV